MIDHQCETRRGPAWSAALAALCCLLATGVPAPAQDASLDALVRAYPEFLVSHDGKVLIWKDGTRMPVSDGRTDKSFEEKLSHASILDQLSIRYVRGPLEKPPGLQDDPGRFRNTAFFDKMYGDCSRGEVQRKLTRVAWLPKSGGGSVQITTVNSVADRLRAVSGNSMVWARAHEIRHSEQRHVQLPHRQRHRQPQHACMGRRYRPQFEICGLLAVEPERRRLPQPHPCRDRGNLREAWLHLGRQVGALDTMHFEYRPELLPALSESTDKDVK